MKGRGGRGFAVVVFGAMVLASCGGGKGDRTEGDPLVAAPDAAGTTPPVGGAGDDGDLPGGGTVADAGQDPGGIPGGSDAGQQPGDLPFLGSCNLGEGGFGFLCLDYSGSSTPEAIGERQLLCVGQDGGQWSATPCPTENRGGTCTVTHGSERIQMRAYGPITPALGAAMCPPSVGVWTPG